MVYKGVVNLHFDTTASAKDAARRIYESRTSARLPSETLAYYADQLRPPNRIFSVEALSMKPERLEATLRTLDLSAVKGFGVLCGSAIRPTCGLKFNRHAEWCCHVHLP